MCLHPGAWEVGSFKVIINYVVSWRLARAMGNAVKKVQKIIKKCNALTKNLYCKIVLNNNL